MSKRANRSRQTWGPYILVGSGLILLAVTGLWYWGGLGGTVARAAYDPADVVYDRPIHGVHEMGPPAQQPPFIDKGQPQPRIEILESFHDLGVVAPEEEPEVTFVVRNAGQAPLTISRVYTTCGCTTADLTGSVIPPGKVALLTLYFDADFHDVTGETVRRGVILENNDRTQPKAEVWIQARVTSDQ